MKWRLAGWLLLAVFLGHTCATPLTYHDPESHPLVVVSDLGQRLTSHARLQEPSGIDPRLGLPTPQELDAIKKVAQILIMLGEQVIPTIIGDISPPPAPAAPHADSCDPPLTEEISNDPVIEN